MLRMTRHICSLPILLVVTAFFICNVSFAQKKTKVELLGADVLEYDESMGTRARKLIGNVKFKHDDAIMTCDSAYMYDVTNSVDAFGHVHINQADTVNLYGDTLKYYGNTKSAELRNNIRLSDKEMTLTTNNLNYEMSDKTAYYFGGGKIVSQKNNNTLTSRVGYYHTKTKEFFFKDSVVLVNPEYTIVSDTLKYNTNTAIAYFYGPTTITGKENFIYCENGWYDTRKDISQFNKNAFLVSKEQKLQGDSLYYERKKGFGKAFKNVQITDTVQKLIINGEKAFYYENEDRSIITGRTLLTMMFDKDSLFLHADTLQALMDTVNQQRILLAYHKVKFFKTDLQGKCDSLAYTYADSTIRLYKDPVIWNEENQMTADLIEIETWDGKIQQMNLLKTAFIISQEDSAKYNQIKGKNITAYFTENELSQIDVNENSETIYYAKEDSGAVMGMNKAKAADLRIMIKNKEIEQISFYKQPEATMSPMKNITPEEMRLSGFVWRIEYKPLSKEDIFTWEIKK